MKNKAKETGILFNAEMMRAALAGRKTQTRRVIKNDYFDIVDGYDKSGELWNSWVDPGAGALQTHAIVCPYGEPGDKIWGRERYRAFLDNDGRYIDINYHLDDTVQRIDAPLCGSEELERQANWTWKNSIHMPRWATRFVRTITDIRVERVQDISHDDIVAEGVTYAHCHDDDLERSRKRNLEGVQRAQAIRKGWAWGMFANLWDSINAKRGFRWDVNPWVWVVEWENE